ncbi:MAG: hypothetical protein R3F46_13935 [bacterium]
MTQGHSATRLRLICLAALLLALLPPGCSGGNSSPAVKPLLPSSGGLPALTDLTLSPLPQRNASYTEADLQLDGSAFDNALPDNLVSPDGAVATFTPDHPGGSPEHGLAYCIYRFNIPGYDRNPQLRLDWQSAPPAGSLHIALANWTSGRWDVFPADPAAYLDLPSITPYIRADGSAFDDTLLCSVILSGTQLAELATIRIGGLAPVISLASTASLTGFVPISGSIDASASTDPDGEIVSFAWDLDGDGTFELESGLVAVQSIERSTPGGFLAQVRATDNDGVSSVRQVAVRGFSEWRHSWGGGGTDSFWASAYDNVGSLFVVGSTTSYGAGASDVLLACFDLSGEIVWQQAWGTAGNDYGWNLGIDSDGNIVVLAKTDDMGASLLKFQPDGELIWARRYSPLTDDFSAASLAVDGSDIYFCGYENVTGQDNQAVIARVDGNGDMLWLRSWENGAVRFSDMTVYRPSIATRAVTVCGSHDGDVLLLALDTDGTFVYAESWGGPDTESGQSLFARGPANAELWVVGSLAEGNQRKCLVLERSNSAPIARVWDAGSTDDDDEVALGIVDGNNGNFFVSGWSASFGDGPDGILLDFSKSGALQASTSLHDLGNDIQFNGELNMLAGQALVCLGVAERSQGTVWNPASGSVSTVNREWQDLVNSITSLSVNGTALSGTITDTTGAVLDSGGGGVTDGIIAVRAAN